MAEIEAHPLPARIMHWLHLLCMVLLAFTGFYIHRPFFEGSMALMRYIHFIAMYVVLINLIARVYWAFFGAPRDFHEYGFGRRDFKTLWSMIRYYTFTKKEHPDTGKYNILQKGTYNFWVFLLIFQGITGFALYEPTMSYFGWFTQWVGGLGHVRTIHFLVMWVFIITTAIHVYLSVAEEIAQFWYMIFGVQPKEE